MGFREHFSSEVRRLRDEHEMTTRELAAQVGYSYDALKSFLTGHRTPTATLATALDRVFNSPGMFATLRERAEADTTPFGELRESEQRATVIRIWSTPVVPGLLQTELYASALLSDPADVRERMERQQIFTRDNPPHVHVIICEGALYNEIGGSAVLCAQLEHLIRPDAPWTLQVMPDSIGSATAADGPFFLFEFDGEEPPIAYLDSRGGGTVADDQAKVSEYWRQWDRLASEALSPTLSREMIAAVIRDLSEE